MFGRLNWVFVFRRGLVTLFSSFTPPYCTVCSIEAELLAIFELQEYVTFTLLEPTGRAEVVNFAMPPLS